MTEDKAYKIAKVIGYQFTVIGDADNYEEAEMLQKEAQAEYGEGETILIFRYCAEKGRYMEAERGNDLRRKDECLRSR